MRKFNQPVTVLILISFISVLSGCTDVKPDRPVDDRILFSNQDLFGKQPPIISKDQIFQLTADQQREFLSYFNDPENQSIATHWRIYYYLQQIVSNFNYQDDTYTAEEAIRLAGGNCLSLAIITTALARLVNVDVGYQLVDDIPVYERSGKVIFKGIHVRSLLNFMEHTSSKSEISFIRSYLKVDYISSGNERLIKDITEPEFIAMYYRNKAADAIAAGDYPKAYWLTRTSLEFEPDNSQAINMMAIVHRQAKDDGAAERVYQYGIARAQDKLTLLKNYRVLLLDQGRDKEAKQISREIEKYADPSPFTMIQLANAAYDNGDYVTAITYYHKATELAPYLHEGYFGLAKSYYKMGYIDAAKHNMQEAVDRSLKSSTRSLYQAKLTALSQKKQVH